MRKHNTAFKALLLGFLFSTGLFLGCPLGTCKDQLDYYDFTRFQVDATQYVGNAINPDNDTTSMNVHIGDWFMVAEAPTPSFSLVPSAHALSCCAGCRGLKNPIVGLEITSNKDFDAAHPAGTSLNDLALYINLWGAQTYFPLDTLSADFPITDIQTQTFILPTAPDSTGEYIYFIKLTKSNGETLIGNSDIVTYY
ncbi:MAG: hypothetical protein AAF570_05735 [Bacteroidota bacterium]